VVARKIAVGGNFPDLGAEPGCDLAGMGQKRMDLALRDAFIDRQDQQPFVGCAGEGAGVIQAAAQIQGAAPGRSRQSASVASGSWVATI
jgi:hypothetical protein